ncbi:MAG: PP2C family protein-serine/threonine phosphatase [Bacteroidota bacterium]|nr:PP2C family protein-serine/threonine phosphatase [Bacteroidota bacterium]MDP4232048.1 PP2C family protein-serine/threonine phosphatase [Bacteroidota bacterium]MDP4241245.1 PP2C family protein-serine/threonine phosphatase [Bacteroidota bacterium]MDP4286637.1 PP2C family protein-serine/threonine phosphatase [Bacteroidota bacterium]
MGSTDLATELQQERYALSSLLEFARTLTPDLGLEGIVRSVLRTVMGTSLIKEAFAYLAIQHDGHDFKRVALAGFSNEDLPKQLDGDGFDRMLADKTRPYTLVPLVGANGTDTIHTAGYLGVLGLGKSINPNLRDESEATYLASLATLTSIALTNALLFEREKQATVERERIESELRLAREIQQSLLPQTLPQLSGAELAAVSRPSEWVGGDYYDAIQLGENRILICVADVVGKGIGAALTMSNLQAALRALAAMLRKGQLSLVDVVKELNRLMTESTAPERFITAAFALLDVDAHEIESIVCGHPNPAIAMPNGTVHSMESTGIPLGIIATFPYESRNYKLESGSLLFFYTDGLSEARYSGEFVGAKGVEELLQHPALRGDLQRTLERIVASPQLTIEDDITVLAIRV